LSRVISDRFEGTKGKEQLDRHVEIGRDLHRKLEAGLVVAALEIADRLVVHAHRIGQLTAGDAALSPKNSDAIIQVCHRIIANQRRYVVFTQRTSSRQWVEQLDRSKGWKMKACDPSKRTTAFGIPRKERESLQRAICGHVIGSGSGAP